VPRASVVRCSDEAVEVARRIGYPVVLKPLDGNHGRGSDDQSCPTRRGARGFPGRGGREPQRSVVVETFIPGKDYRILVVNNQVVAVAERVPAHVLGDGSDTSPS
jgi:cyanophycin synthetase